MARNRKKTPPALRRHGGCGSTISVHGEPFERRVAEALKLSRRAQRVSLVEVADGIGIGYQSAIVAEGVLMREAEDAVGWEATRASPLRASRGHSPSACTVKGKRCE